MARGTQPGEQPHYVKKKDREIERLKKDLSTLQLTLDFLFDTKRDWLKATTAELLELRERFKQGSKDES